MAIVSLSPWRDAGANLCFWGRLSLLAHRSGSYFSVAAVSCEMVRSDSISALVVPLLNQYLGGMTRIMFRHGGTMEKIVGDAVHVIFRAPMEQIDHAICGVACAMEMDSFAETFRKKKNNDGLPVGVTRIGVHSGPAIVGNFGGDLFFDYTAYGDAINTAARLEGINKFLETRICVRQEAVNQIPNFKGRQVGTLVLKGKSEGVNVYEPLNAELSELRATEAYRAAFAKLEKGDAAASQSFSALVGQYGDDPLATFHLKRLLAGETGVEIAFREK